MAIQETKIRLKNQTIRKEREIEIKRKSPKKKRHWRRDGKKERDCLKNTDRKKENLLLWGLSNIILCPFYRFYH
jgi:hypothetical protein